MIIKHQLKLHLNELIDYVWKHDIKNQKYSSNNGSYVIFDNGAVTKTYIINKNDLFNVDDEIEITMDSPISHFLEKDIYNNYREHQNIAIKDLLFLNTTSDIWLINDDDSHILIYKDGQLIDKYQYKTYEYEANQNKKVYDINRASGTYPSGEPSQTKPEHHKKQPDHKNIPTVKTVKTLNGTVMQDYTPISSIRNIKSIGIIGDSVAKGSYSSQNFGDMFREKLNINVENVAESSATYSTHSDNNMINQSKQIKNKDLVIVQGTDDDWLNGDGVEIGNHDDKNDTYIGAMKEIINNIREQNKNVKIIVMTPTKQAKVNDNGDVIRRDTDKNKKGLSLNDYVTAQVSEAKRLNVALYNAYTDPLINPYDETFRHSSMKDGLHPTKWGHEMIYYKLIQQYYEFFDEGV